MIINFNGIEPEFKFYRVGVMDNNDVDEIVFILTALTLNLKDFKPFLKMTSPDLVYTDKDGNLEITPGKKSLHLRYCVPRKVSENKTLDMQLQFEDVTKPGIAVWQTMIFNVSFAESIKADAAIANKNPSILQEHEKRLAALESAPAVIEYPSRFDFPNVGAPATVYIDVAENTLYRYNADNNTYYIVGNDYNEIKIINGGT